MKPKLKYKILLAIFIIALISSIMLSFSLDVGLCSAEETSDCDIVAASPQNYTLGIKNSHFGIIIFTALSILTFLQIKNHSEDRKETINWAVILGSAIALYFIYLQKFVIQAYCKYCLIVDISMLIGLIIVLKNWKE